MSVSRAETKKVRALQTKKGRRLAGCYLAEGVRLLEEALRFGTRPEKLYYSDALVSDRARNLGDELLYPVRERCRLPEIVSQNLNRNWFACHSRGRCRNRALGSD